jgi:hypothetical protein
MRFAPATPRRRTTAAIAMVLAVGLLGAGPPAGSPPTVLPELASAADFAVLAGDGIIETGVSHITGDVGSYPLPTISNEVDRATVGLVDRAGTTAKQAQHDLAGADAAIADTVPTRAVDLAGNLVLPGGTYALTSATTTVAGHLTLDGLGKAASTWIFLVPGDLATESGSTITLVNGALVCNVFWRIAGAATLAPRSDFAGNLLAVGSITLGKGLVIDGRILSTTGRVTLDSDTITAPVCADAPVPAAPAAVVPPPKQAADADLVSRTSGGAGDTPFTVLRLAPIVVIVLALAAVLLAEPRRRPLPSASWGP